MRPISWSLLIKSPQIERLTSNIERPTPNIDDAALYLL
jgi:hypothetical protein